jgi:uncharacterized membrane protein
MASQGNSRIPRFKRHAERIRKTCDIRRLDGTWHTVTSGARCTPRRLVVYFTHGLIIVIPLGVTIWIIAWLFNLIDGMLGPIYTWGFGRHIPGLGFATIIVCTVVIGYFGYKAGWRKIFGLFESWVVKIPIAGAIYGSTRQILESFTVPSGKKFLEVVFMEFPRKGIYTVGFVTSEVVGKDGHKVLNVFIPTAPNPTTGFLQIVAEADVVHSSLSVSDAMKLVISAGKVSRQEVADVLVQVPAREGDTGGPEGPVLTSQRSRYQPEERVDDNIML